MEESTIAGLIVALNTDNRTGVNAGAGVVTDSHAISGDPAHATMATVESAIASENENVKDGISAAVRVAKSTDLGATERADMIVGIRTGVRINASLDVSPSVGTDESMGMSANLSTNVKTVLSVNVSVDVSVSLRFSAGENNSNDLIFGVAEVAGLSLDVSLDVCFSVRVIMYVSLSVCAS